VGIGYSRNSPVCGFNRPILFARNSVNQTSPLQISRSMGPLFGVGIEYSISRPSRVRKPILLAWNSVKRTPMPTEMTDVGPLFGVGRGRSLKIPFAPARGAAIARSRTRNQARRRTGSM